MGKRTIWDNYRVVINPREKGDYGIVKTTMFGAWSAEEERRICEDIQDAVKKASRAGFIEDVGSIVIEHDTEEVCEHCGYHWGEKSPDYNGGCCDKDQVAEDARPVEASS